MFNFLFSNNKKNKQVEISPSIVIYTIIYLLGLYFLYYIRSILILIFLAFIIMVALNPIVKQIKKITNLPRNIAIIITYILAIVVLFALFALIIPSLFKELYLLLKLIDLPFLQEELSNLQLTFLEISDLVNKFKGSINTAISLINTTFTGVFTFFSLIVISYYLMLERPSLHLKLAWFTTKRKHIKLAKKLFDTLEKQLGGWIRGQLILMSTIGVITYIGLLLLSIPYALPLGILAALLEILPNLGPTIAAVPAIIIAYANTNYVITIIVSIFYVVVQQLENNIVVPRVMRANADVNPLIAIITILIGFKVASVVGALLAIPTYIIVRSVYSTYRKYRYKNVELEKILSKEKEAKT